MDGETYCHYCIMCSRDAVWLHIFSINLLLYIPQILPLKLKRGQTSFQLRDLGYTSTKCTVSGAKHHLLPCVTCDVTLDLSHHLNHYHHFL